MVRKPVYEFNKSQARTTHNGERMCLSEYNSPESKAAFEKTIAEWEAAHPERKPVVSLHDQETLGFVVRFGFEVRC